MKADESGPPSAAGDQSERWELRLYVAGVTSKYVKAFTNLKKGFAGSTCRVVIRSSWSTFWSRS